MRFNKYFALCLAAASLFFRSEVSADVGQIIPMGDLERWAAFSIGSDNSQDRLSDSANVDGDFAAAGTGTLRVLGSAVITGDLYYASHRLLWAPQPGAILGSRFRAQDVLLRNEILEARAAARAAVLLDANRAFNLIALNQNQTLTIAGAPGETVVLNLGNFRLSGDSILTLQGGPNTNFIINVSNQFSLADNARIVLAGGLNWNNVLFNVWGKKGAVRLSGNSRFEGILLANRRAVQIRDQAILRGEVIADSLLIGNSGQIIHPPVVSP